LVSHLIAAHPLNAITMKGISREVRPYQVDRLLDAVRDKSDVVVETLTGLNFYLDPAVVEAKDADRIRSILSNAIAALERRQAKSA
jgi:adenylate cyclase